jgi:hypothetical protein
MGDFQDQGLEPFQRDLMCYSGDAVGQGGSIMEKIPPRSRGVIYDVTIDTSCILARMAHRR